MMSCLSTRFTGCIPRSRRSSIRPWRTFYIDIIIGEGPGARSIKMPLPHFTLVGATTRAGLLTAPLRGTIRNHPSARVLRQRGLEHDRASIGANPGRGYRRGRRARNSFPKPRDAAHRQPAAATRARLCGSERPMDTSIAPSPWMH